jgi:hypothetical protein
MVNNTTSKFKGMEEISIENSDSDKDENNSDNVSIISEQNESLYEYSMARDDINPNYNNITTINNNNNNTIDIDERYVDNENERNDDQHYDDYDYNSNDSSDDSASRLTKSKSEDSQYYKMRYQSSNPSTPLPNRRLRANTNINSLTPSSTTMTASSSSQNLSNLMRPTFASKARTLTYSRSATDAGRLATSTSKINRIFSKSNANIKQL